MNDHDHHAVDGHSHVPASSMPHAVSGQGHNRPTAAVQWQVPHLPEGAAPPATAERDLDLVGTSFVESFGRAPDPASFLRLAKIPFVGVDGGGRRLHLLRVEMESLTDIGAVSPLLGGEGVRYDPLPSRMISHRRRLAFVYHDGKGLARLAFAEARALVDESAPSHFSIKPGS